MEKKTQYLITSGIILALLLISISLHFHFVGFDLMQSDVLSYWNDSLKISAPFNSFHVPLFPITIFILRSVTGNFLPPILNMQIITILSLFLCSYLVFRIIGSDNIEPTSKQLGKLMTWIYILWPFVGLTSVIFPLSDIFGLLLFISGLFLLIQKKYAVGFAIWGLTFLVHKALWPFVILCFLCFCLNFARFEKGQTRPNRKKWLIYSIVLFLPILALWIGGSIYHKDIFWIIQSNLSVEIASKSELPVLDGLIGIFNSGISKIIVKGGALLFALLLAIFCFIVSVKKTYPLWIFGIGISVAEFLLIVILNQAEIWAAFRFSRLLLLPLGWFLMEQLKTHNFLNALSGKKKVIPITLLSLLALSQFAYAWYMSQIYFN